MEAGSPERKGLVVSASAIILFELAGGTFKDAQTPLFSLTLQDPGWLLYALWLYFGFALWRYWQSLGSLSWRTGLGLYRAKLQARICADPRYRRLVRQLPLPDGFEVGKNVPEHPLIRRRLFSRYVDFRHSYRDSPRDDISYRAAAPVCRVPYSALALLEVSAHLGLMVKDRWWVDVVFPWVLAAAALFAILARRLL